MPSLDAVAARLRAAGCVYAEDEAALLLSAGGDVESLVARRVGGEPLEYVLGWAAFCGVRVRVAPGVFVPRLRTSVLVSCVLPRVRTGSVVVDMCCGTGAVGAALLAVDASLEVYACDVDPAAVAVATLTVPVALCGDLFSALPTSLAGRVDVVVANAPYVPTGEIAFMPSEARDHEHLVALDGGADGLDLHRRLATEAPLWLQPGGWLVIETSQRQADLTLSLVESAGFVADVVRDDDVDGTAVVGQLSRSPAG